MPDENVCLACFWLRSLDYILLHTYTHISGRPSRLAGSTSSNALSQRAPVEFMRPYALCLLGVRVRVHILYTPTIPKSGALSLCVWCQTSGRAREFLRTYITGDKATQRRHVRKQDAAWCLIRFAFKRYYLHMLAQMWTSLRRALWQRYKRNEIEITTHATAKI